MKTLKASEITEPGYYWFVDHPGSSAKIVKVYNDDPDQRLRVRMFADYNRYPLDAFAHPDYEFVGPIPPPAVKDDAEVSAGTGGD